jgi:zinc protease
MSVDRSRLPALGPHPSFRSPGFRRSTLSNGVGVWTATHRRAKVLTLRLLIPVGSADDPVDQAGLAALTADVLDEGTRALTDVALHAALSRIGAHLGIGVSSDATILTLTTLPKHAVEAMALLVDVVVNPRFDSDDCERVRDLRLNRLLQMRQVPAAVADRVFIESLYGEHPYGHLLVGTDVSLSALDSSDISAFHDRWYRPETWTLVAVGDLTDDALLDVGQILEAVPPVTSTVASRGVSRRQEPPAVADRLVFVSRKNAVQSEVRLGHLGVSREAQGYHALLVLNMVLGGQFVSRINLNLREDKGYTYGARTAFDYRVGRGPFVFRSSVQTSATVDAMSEAIKEFREIREARPPSERELAVAKAALTRGFPLGFETATQVARVGTTLALHGLPSDETDRFVERVMAVDTDAVVAAARAHLHPDELLAVVVGSPDDVLPSLGRLGLGEPALLD